MKIYLAGEQFAGVEELVDRRLFSYWYNRTKLGAIERAYEWGQDLFLDSGAFTAFTQGIEIQPASYARYIQKYGHMFGPIANLDSIDGGAQASWDNMEQLEAEGVSVLPVFHQGEPWEFLERMLEKYDYILIGGLVGVSRAVLLSWLDIVWGDYLTNSDGTPCVKAHGFGLTDQVLMFRYPWHSVDSTSWLFTGSFGNCTFLLDGKLQKISFSSDSPDKHNINSVHYSLLPDITRAHVEGILTEFGVTAKECSEHYSFRNQVNARTYMQMEKLGVDHFVPEQKGLF